MSLPLAKPKNRVIDGNEPKNKMADSNPRESIIFMYESTQMYRITMDIMVKAQTFVHEVPRPLL